MVVCADYGMTGALRKLDIRTLPKRAIFWEVGGRDQNGLKNQLLGIGTQVTRFKQYHTLFKTHIQICKISSDQTWNRCVVLTLSEAPLFVFVSCCVSHLCLCLHLRTLSFVFGLRILSKNCCFYSG